MIWLQVRSFLFSFLFSMTRREKREKRDLPTQRQPHWALVNIVISDSLSVFFSLSLIRSLSIFLSSSFSSILMTFNSFVKSQWQSKQFSFHNWWKIGMTTIEMFASTQLTFRKSMDYLGLLGITSFSPFHPLNFVK